VELDLDLREGKHSVDLVDIRRRDLEVVGQPPSDTDLEIATVLGILGGH
jgi:hypothetical protein